MHVGPAEWKVWRARSSWVVASLLVYAVSVVGSGIWTLIFRMSCPCSWSSWGVVSDDGGRRRQR